MRQKHPIQRRALWLGFLTVRSLTRWLPWSVAQATGRLLGYVAYAVLPRHRRLTFEHLQLALGPRASRGTQRRVARGVFVNLGKSFMEWQVLDRFSPDRIRRLVDLHGAHYLHEAVAKGRGVILLTAHFGNWELLAMGLSCSGFRGCTLARRLRYPEYEQVVRSMRLRKGVPTLSRDSIKEVVQALRDNQVVGLMPDQDIDSLEGIFVDFFDRPAHTPVGPAALSLLTGAPIVPCFIIRNGRRFRIEVDEPIAIVRSGDREQDLRQMTEAWSRVVESYIRRHPAHWVWMHRRWKTQPSAIPRPAPPLASSTERTGPRRVPQLALALLCLLSFAQGCAKSSGRPSADSTEPVAPQQMDTFTMTGYTPEGTKQWDLEGLGAVAEGQMVTIQRPNAVGYDVARTSYLSARLAHVNQTTRDIRLEYDVVVHTSDGLWLFSPELFWLSARNEVVTDQPVRLETDHMALWGRGATANDRLKIAVIQRDIEMVMSPSGDSSSMGMTPSRATPSQARASEGPPAPVTIRCDGPLTFEYQKGVATFERNVHVTDVKGDLYGDRLIAYVDQTTRTINYAEIFGHVRILQGPHTAEGEHAVYEPDKAKVTLLGAPSLLVYPDGTSASPPTVPAPSAVH